MPLSDSESIQGRVAKIGNVTFRLQNSRGGHIGPDADNLYDAFYQDALISCSGQDLLDNDLFTGDIRQPLGSGYPTGGRVFYRQIDPLPITIGAIMPEVSVGGYVR